MSKGEDQKFERSIESYKRMQIYSAIADCRRGELSAFVILKGMSDKELNNYGVKKNEFLGWLVNYQSISRLIE